MVVRTLARTARRLQQFFVRRSAATPDAKGSVTQCGQSIVELALISPILLLILLGAVDLGRVYYTYVAIENAARVGAELAMDPRRNVTEVREAIKREAAPLLEINDSDIAFITLGWAPGNDLTVEVRTRFTALTPLINNVWGGEPLTITGRTTIRFTSA